LRPGRPRPVELPSLQGKPAPDKSRSRSGPRSARRRSCEAHGTGAGDSGAGEGGGTGRDRRTGRDHVVHEQGHHARSGARGDFRRVARRRGAVGARHIARSISAARTCLPSVGAGPTQEGLHRPAKCFPETFGDQASLIVPALAPSRCRQRNRYQHRRLRSDSPGDGAHERTHSRRQRSPARVLESMDEPNGRRYEQKRRVRSNQLIGPVGALRAALRDCEIGQARVPAARAPRSRDLLQPALAGTAQRGPTRCHRHRAGDADGGQQRVEQPGGESSAPGGDLHDLELSRARCMEARTDGDMAHPNQRSSDRTPCSSSTRRPSSAFAPWARAWETQGVPPGR